MKRMFSDFNNEEKKVQVIMSPPLDTPSRAS